MTEETEKRGSAEEHGQNKQDPEQGVQPRGKWANKTEFILSMAGEIIGLGNVWRFPYLCYKNGGGVFLIPYCVFLFCCGIPVFFLETALGQYTSEGGVTTWRKICPMFEGVGVATQVIVIYFNIYYIVVLAWAIFYLINSFKSPLPWSSCANLWNTDFCFSRPGLFANPELFNKDSNWSFLHNISSNGYEDDFGNFNETLLKVSSPEEEFWENRVLRMSHGNGLGNVHWELALCLLLAWVICYFCIWKGIKTTGKVVYFTATFPYLMLIILFIRGVTLPGAGDGLKYYLKPDFSKLAELNVWHDAGMQVFHSYAMCQGVLTALGSYNKYNNNCYKDCLALCCLNSATSIFAGFVIFSIIGFMAHDLNIPISEITASGPGLAFIAYPRALSLLPGSSFWAVLFFLMILFLGLDNQFVCVESLATAITDLFPSRLRRPGARQILGLVIAVTCFLLGLPFVTEGGIGLLRIVDTFGPSGISLLLIACAETLVVSWIYGADRFYDNIEDMIGYRPSPVLKYCWMFVTPLLCVVIMLYTLAKDSPLSVYSELFGSSTSTIAALLIATPLICIPAFIFIALCRDPCNMTRPSKDLRQVSPGKPVLTMCNLVIFQSQQQPNRNLEERNMKTAEELTPFGINR